jgi:hypothetical protein
MLFADKLKILMDITNTSNKALAKHLIVDPSMISQLRTGARRVTKKNIHVKNMAFYFAQKCQSPSRMLALHELIQKEELKNECSVAGLSDIIYEFLMNDNTDDSAGNSPYGAEWELYKHNPRVRKAELQQYEFTQCGFKVCDSLDEKKCYMKKLFEYYLTLETPNVIYFASEEVVEWVYNDPEYYNDFRSWCLTLIDKGFSFVRIMKPMENKGHFLENILLWLPMYMTGRVHLYYYPHYRDDIYRQSVIAVDGAAAYFSSSIARGGKCYYSFFCNDAALSSAYVEQIKDYLAFCKSSFYVCNSQQTMGAAFLELMGMQEERITKSYYLSMESIPYKAFMRYMRMSDDPVYMSAAESVEHIYSALPEEKGNAVIIDMSTLATADEVKRGAVRLYLPGLIMKEPVYYDTALYVLHLKNILHLLEVNPNYCFYPIEPDEFGEYGNDYSPVSIVDNRAAVLVTEERMLRFTQPEIIHTLYEHLYNEAKIRQRDCGGREKVMHRIRQLLEELV